MRNKKYLTDGDNHIFILESLWQVIDEVILMKKWCIFKGRLRGATFLGIENMRNRKYLIHGRGGGNFLFMYMHI
jgi:hypothetical protein